MNNKVPWSKCRDQSWWKIEWKYIFWNKCINIVLRQDELPWSVTLLVALTMVWVVATTGVSFRLGTQWRIRCSILVCLLMAAVTAISVYFLKSYSSTAGIVFEAEIKPRVWQNGEGVSNHAIQWAVLCILGPLTGCESNLHSQLSEGHAIRERSATWLPLCVWFLTMGFKPGQFVNSPFIWTHALSFTILRCLLFWHICEDCTVPFLTLNQIVLQC